MARSRVTGVPDAILVVVGLPVVVHLRAVVLGIRGGVTIVGDHRVRGRRRGGTGLAGDSQRDLAYELFGLGVGQQGSCGGFVELPVTIQVPLVRGDLPSGAVGASRIQSKGFSDGVRV